MVSLASTEPLPVNFKFPVSVNFRLVSLLQVSSALSTKLAPMHGECSKVMLTSLSMIKLQPNVCNQLSRPKRAHSASPIQATGEKDYLCETLISDSLTCQNYAWFWFWHKASNWVGQLTPFSQNCRNMEQTGGGGSYSSRSSNYSPKAGLTHDCCYHKLESL